MNKLIVASIIGFLWVACASGESGIYSDGSGYTYSTGDKSYTFDIVDGGAIVTAGSVGTNGTESVPSSLGGCPVRSIGKSAYAYSSALTSVSLPDSITNIGPYAFCCCSNLESITVSSQLESIGDSAFYQSGLKSLVLPDGVRFIGYLAFGECANLTDFRAGSSAWAMGGCAFNGCSSLTNLVLGGVTNISNGVLGLFVLAVPNHSG